MIEKQKYYGCIYQTTNLINNKQYIGQTIRIDRVRSGSYKGSGNLINDAFKKYQRKNFKTDIIDYANNQYELDSLEKYYILKYNCIRPNGYNLESGGIGKGIIHEATRRKIGLASKGRKLSEEAKRKVSIFNKGKTLSKEHIEKLRLANIGKVISEESRKKMSVARKGKKLSEEHKKKFSETRKGELNGMYGKRHSLEAKLKISEANKGRVAYNKGIPMSEEQKEKLRKIKLTCDVKDWNNATEQQLQKRDKIQDNISLLAEVLNDINAAVRIAIAKAIN